MRNVSSLLRLFCLISICVLPIGHLYADWSNFIVNYHKGLYGKGSQTWKIASYDKYWVNFANKNGMLQYDGNTWNIYPLNNRSDVRSVFPSTNDHRIYVGGIHEFGYFEPGESGKLSYTCMSDSLEENDRSIGNIWGIHEVDNMLYFQGDSRVIKKLGDKYTVIDSGGLKIDCSDMINGILYIGTDKGVQVLIGNTFFPLKGGEALTSYRIRGIVPHEKGVLIATAYDGLFYYDGELVTPYPLGIESFLAENEVFCVASRENKIALGTVHKGIVLIDKKTPDAKYFNENNGLQNNTVLSVSFDYFGNLWAGLDNGIDYIHLSSSNTNLYTYPYFYGTGYDALLANENLYLATNRGLYCTPYPVQFKEGNPDIRSMPNSSGQVWGVKQIGDEIFCLHDRGVFLVEGERMRRIGQINGAWTCQLVDNTSDKLYVGVYDGLYVLEKKANEWEVSHRVEGIIESCRFFEQESDRVIWLSNSGKLRRIELDRELKNVVKVEVYGEDKELPFVYEKEIPVNRVNGKVFFSSPAGTYIYNSSTRKIEPSEEMNTLLGHKGSFYRLMQLKGHIVGLNSQEICISNLTNYKKGAETITLPLDVPSIELVQGAETFIPLLDSLIVIPNDKGFALAKLSRDKMVKGHHKVVNVRNVHVSYPKDSLIYTDNFLSRKETPSLSFLQNTIRFEYGVPSFIYSEDVSYQYRLNKGEWSDYTKLLTKEYSNLSEGNYTFEVKALFPDGIFATDSFSFLILAPWYRSTAAYVFYLALLLGLMWCIYRWDDIRVNRKKQQAVVEKDKEIREKEKEFERENARKEKQIIQLEKEKLEHELQYKSQEMANLMINFVRKNEILTEIKSDLFKVISVMKGEGNKEPKQLLLVVNNKIDSNIQSDELLKRFEEQFDLVHNNFMKRLQEKHPDLSLNERMMCAYLIMNLSTKEIAPLLNLSVRGVETIRYRIRKKFSLEREDSLVEYLNHKI